MKELRHFVGVFGQVILVEHKDSLWDRQETEDVTLERAMSRD